MRKAFINRLTELAQQDERIVLLTADLGYTVIEGFADTHPKRFYNVGCAEQNMVGIAVGMAQAGYIPFCYSIGNFAVLRPYEFIRNAALQRAQIRIVGCGVGKEYGNLGATHWMLSDIGAMRLIPEMEIVTPADDWQCVRALSQTWDNGSPVFYRLSKQSAPVNPQNSIGTFNRHRAEPVRAHLNAKTLILGQGPCVYEVPNLDSDAAVYHVSGYSPNRELPFDMDRFRTIITVEDHLATGGLGDYAARYIATRGLKARLHTCAWGNYKTRTAELTAATLNYWEGA